MVTPNEPQYWLEVFRNELYKEFINITTNKSYDFFPPWAHCEVVVLFAVQQRNIAKMHHFKKLTHSLRKRQKYAFTKKFFTYRRSCQLHKMKSYVTVDFVLKTNSK